MNFCLQTTLACKHASEGGFCMESRCVKILDEILPKTREALACPAEGRPGTCPKCDSTEIYWDSKCDVFLCRKCGCSNLGGNMKKATCRGCGAPIVWIRTTGGKSMPCDAEAVLYKERKGAAGKIVTPNGEVLSCELDVEPDEATGIGYISHFVTCPQAEWFRRK